MRRNDVVTISPNVEGLARAMCAALGVNADEPTSRDPDWHPYPLIEEPAALMVQTRRWHDFAWQARLWIFENSGGSL